MHAGIGHQLNRRELSPPPVTTDCPGMRENAHNPLCTHSPALDDTPTGRHIQDIPNEVLEVILHATLEVSPGRDRHTSLNRITTVCRLWRARALASPRFWCHLPDMIFDECNKKPPDYRCSWHSERQRRAVEQFIERSGSLPLTFRFHLLKLPTGDTLFLGSLEKAIASLLPHSHRWFSVELHVSYNSLQLMTSITSNLPILHSLVLRYRMHPEDPEHLSIDHFVDCPNLRHASFTFDSSHAYVHPQISIPWHQLDSFDDHRFNRCRRIVAKHTEDFAVEDGGGVTAKLTMLSATHHSLNHELARFSPSTLTTLHLRFVCQQGTRLSATLASSFVSQVKFPFLRHLHLDYSFLPLSQLFIFIQSLGCTLHTLDLRVHSSQEAVPGGQPSTLPTTRSLSDLLELCDTLEELRLRAPLIPSSEDLFKISQRTLVPRLRALTIQIPYTQSSRGETGSHFHVLDYQELGSMASRCDNLDLTLEFQVYDRALCREVLHLLVCASMRAHSPRTHPHTPLNWSPGPTSSITGTLQLDEDKFSRWRSKLGKLAERKSDTKPRYNGSILFYILSYSTINRKLARYNQEGMAIHHLLEELEQYPIDKAGVEGMILLRKHEIVAFLGLCASQAPAFIPCASEYNTCSRLRDLHLTWLAYTALYPEVEDACQRWALKDIFHPREWPSRYQQTVFGTRALVYVPDFPRPSKERVCKILPVGNPSYVVPREDS